MAEALIYKTPGVECQHADLGCCPSCRPRYRPRRGHMYTPFKDNVSKMDLRGLKESTVGRRLLFNFFGSAT